MKMEVEVMDYDIVAKRENCQSGSRAVGLCMAVRLT